MLKLVKPKLTKFEELEVKKQKKLKEIATLQLEIEKAEARHRDMVKNGEETGQVRSILLKAREEIKLLQEEVKVLEQAQAEAELKHVQTKMVELERQGQKVASELETHRQVYEEAKATFEQAEKLWFSKHSEVQEELNRINRLKSELRPKLEQLMPEHKPEPEHSVAEWLQLFRQEGVKSYIQGQDDNIDIAYQQYEAETKDIQSWAKRAAIIAKQSSGGNPSKPACAGHYSKERLAEITKKAKQKLPAGKDFRPTRSKKVSI